MSINFYQHIKQINNVFFIESALIVNKIIYTSLCFLFLFLHLPIEYTANHMNYGSIILFSQTIHTTILAKCFLVVVVIVGLLLLILNILKSIQTLINYKIICNRNGLSKNRVFVAIFFYTTFIDKVYVPLVYVPTLVCFISLSIYNFAKLGFDIFNFWLYAVMSLYAISFIFYEIFYILKSCYIFSFLSKYHLKKLGSIKQNLI